MIGGLLAAAGKAVLGKGFVGSLVKGAAGAVLGGAIDRRFNKAALSDKYGYLEGKGLTPQEIAGSGFGAQGGTGAAQTLGNQAAQLEAQQRNLEFQQAERDKDRALQVRAQDMGLMQTQTAADASVRSSVISAGASRYGADTQSAIAAGQLALAQDRFANVELPDALRKAVTQSAPFRRLEIMAQMGMDNVIGTVIAASYGLNPMDPDSLKAMGADEFLRMVTDIRGLQSTIFQEAAGAFTIGSTARGLLGNSGFGDNGGAKPPSSQGRRDQR